MMNRLAVAVACSLTLASCSIPVTGSRAIPKAVATLEVGKTSYAELEDRLGKPQIADRSDKRRVANWSSGAVSMGAASLIGSNDVVFQSLGVEYDETGTVRRAVSHSNKRRTTLATPFQTSHVAGAVRDPNHFSRMTRVSQIEAELGPPQFKRVTLEGEAWQWVGYPGAPGNGILTVDLDRNGRIRRTRLN